MCAASLIANDGNVGLSAPINVSLTGAASETITWLHNDLGGNTIMATDSLGGTLWKENFTPFGDRVIKDATATSNNRQWFAGKPQDSETGLSYFGARYYDPAVGRFMGIDAARFSEGNLHSFNRYAYGNNNPLRFIDPTGYSALSIFDWKDFAVDVGGLYVNHIVYAVAKINGNEAVAEFATQALAAGVVDAAISTAGVINPAPGSGSLMRAAVKSEVKAVETAAATEAKVLYHYTDAAGAKGIAESGKILPNSKGQVFLTDKKLSADEARNTLFTTKTEKGSHVVEINAKDGLSINAGKNKNELIHTGTMRDGRSGDFKVKPNE